MADAHAAPLNSGECRQPVLDDLVKLCRSLNTARAQYLVVGGFAMRAAGFIRDTMDVDLLVETGVENEARVIEGMMILPDQAVRDIKPGEVGQYGVVRVGDEILVDLMKSGCGVTYADAIQDAVWRDVDGVRIPFASPSTMWRMKQTPRAKDIPDRLYLQQLLAEQGITVGPAQTGAPLGRVPSWLKRLFGKTSQ